MLGSAILPKRVFDGGADVDLNELYAIRHPVCDAARHNGMCWNAPPTSLPRATGMVAPGRIADTIRDRMGVPSISRRINSVRTYDPCEWPISTTPRPLLSCAR